MKVGKYDIPYYRVHPKLFQATKILFENFKSEEASDMLTVAKLLGHKTEKSGALLTKLADLRSYGLITKRGVKVTDLGKKLTYDPSDAERNKAYKEALLNIPLFKELYSRFGKNLPTSNFWVKLTKITGLEAPDAQKVEKTVQNAYLTDFKYLKEEKEPEKRVSDMEVEDKVDTPAAISTSVERQANIVQNLIKEGAYDIAKNFIDFIKEKKEETPEEEG
ncbi:MAG: hypothetical protein OEY88_03260 [Candidatus Bathyarchaeota archaeon]|nr:hypothetical protein [Candidatus Bathyarchaeota archaeon]